LAKILTSFPKLKKFTFSGDEKSRLFTGFLARIKKRHNDSIFEFLALCLHAETSPTSLIFVL